jgi:hypothetical protein
MSHLEFGVKGLDFTTKTEEPQGYSDLLCGIVSFKFERPSLNMHVYHQSRACESLLNSRKSCIWHYHIIIFGKKIMTALFVRFNLLHILDF